LDIKEIKQIVDLMKRSDLTEFAVEEENFKLQIKRGSKTQGPAQVLTVAAPQPSAPQPAPSASSQAQPSKPDDDASATYITSPMVGTFYAAPSPESPPFTKPGEAVQADTVVCIIEAMKIMNEIQAEASGTIAELLVENGQPVEYGQKLFRLA